MEEEAAEVDYNVKPLCYKAENGRLYMRIGDEMVEQAIPKSPKDAYQRIQGMIGLQRRISENTGNDRTPRRAAPYP